MRLAGLRLIPCAADGRPPKTEKDPEITLPDTVAGFAAAALVAIAQASPERPVITAKTLPEINASTTILTRLGFVRAGVVQDDDIGDAWLWRLA